MVGIAKAIDRLRAHLQAIGVDAQAATPDPAEESREKETRPHGLVYIERSPISCAIVHGDEESYKVAYAVPDRRRLPRQFLEAIPIRAFPVFGSIIDVRWKTSANDRWPDRSQGLGVAKSLTGDEGIRSAIVGMLRFTSREILNNDFGFGRIHVLTNPEHGCWLIGSDTIFGGVPFAKISASGRYARRWFCYEKIAAHLLAAPL